MKNTNTCFHLPILTILFGVILQSCHTNADIIPAKSIDEQLADQGLTRTILGNKLANPYSLENMQVALDSIKSILVAQNPNGRAASVAEDIEVETTDLYVRFLPKDSTQREVMMDDTTMVYYDYPLDYEIVEEGDVYVDSAWTDQSQPWLYTVVKPDFVFPDTIQYEQLSELFIPENHPDFIDPDSLDTSGRTDGLFGELLLRMETMSLSMTNNLTDEEKEVIEESLGGRTEGFWSSWFPPKWNPDGYVKVRERIDERTKGWMPVKYVRVRARRWFTIKTDYTDAHGYYRIGSFRRAVNYSVVFKTPDVKITNWIGWAGRDTGPKRRGRWDVYYHWHSDDWVRATLVNAAAEYDVQRRRTGIEDPFDRA